MRQPTLQEALHTQMGQVSTAATQTWASDVEPWRAKLEEAERGNWARLVAHGSQHRQVLGQRALYMLDDALNWLSEIPQCSLQAIVTDPPYGLVEYNAEHLGKRRQGRGGVWRIPPSFDGAMRSPLPRFTVLSEREIHALHAFFSDFSNAAAQALVPGGHLLMASNPLLSTTAFHALLTAGLEKRGEVIRQVQTLRGGDRPKGAEGEFNEISVMPRSCWEPWGVFRKPFKGTVAQNLRRWGTGGLRRPDSGRPFKDVIACSPTRGIERKIAPHPSLKPQRFLRQIVRAVLPLGVGIVCDPFAGSGSTLAAASAVGYRSVGVDHDRENLDMAHKAFEHLAALRCGGHDTG